MHNRREKRRDGTPVPVALTVKMKGDYMMEQVVSKECLIKTIFEEMEKKDNKDVKILNVRIFNEDGKSHAFADVYYKWYLHGHEKNVEHKDVLFIFADGIWHSHLFF